MPIILLLPNPRSLHGQQLTFKSLVKSILAMTFLGQNGLDQEVYSYIGKMDEIKEGNLTFEGDMCTLSKVIPQ